MIIKNNEKTREINFSATPKNGGWPLELTLDVMYSTNPSMWEPITAPQVEDYMHKESMKSINFLTNNSNDVNPEVCLLLAEPYVKTRYFVQFSQTIVEEVTKKGDHIKYISYCKNNGLIEWE